MIVKDLQKHVEDVGGVLKGIGHLKHLIMNGYYKRVSYKGSTSGFQPDDRGSIPLTRSII